MYCRLCCKQSEIFLIIILSWVFFNIQKRSDKDEGIPDKDDAEETLKSSFVKNDSVEEKEEDNNGEQLINS